AWYFLADIGEQEPVTDLFAAAARLDPTAVADVIPPGVRRDVEDAPAAPPDGDDVVIELGPWTPRAPARHLLPSLALLTPREYAVRFEVCGRRGASWTAWIATATLGGDGFAPVRAAADGLTAESDEIPPPPSGPRRSAPRRCTGFRAICCVFRIGRRPRGVSGGGCPSWRRSGSARGS